jgi:hypothetical protein
MTKKMSKEVKKYLKNELMKYIKTKQDAEKKIINHAYFEKKEYEKIKKVH